MSTLNLIDLIQTGKTREMESSFEEIMQTKMDDALEYRKMEIAHSMFDTVEESEEIDEGWKKEDPKSQEKTNRDRVGTKVTTPKGSGTIHVERKRPTFSQLAPYAHEITVKHEDGTTSTHPAKSVKMVKESQSKMTVYQVTHDGSPDSEEKPLFPRGETVINHTTYFKDSAERAHKRLKGLGYHNVVTKNNGLE
jgi:hypothetical protein